MKNIAICIPSYNECHVIKQTLLKIDKGLTYYQKKGYNVMIFNIDNNSQDGTNAIFNKTKTICPKKSIITSELGKGVNLLNFFKCCEKYDIDYAVTIDADVISLKPNWIKKFLSPLLDNYCDYVTPLYKRSRFEGSSTNHFAFPLVYATTGKYIRQPIAGDFAFNKKFIKLINKQNTNDSIRKYGIDIFMTLIACANNLKIAQIDLEKKIHNPSYNKIEKMFPDILNSAIFTLVELKNQGKLYSTSNNTRKYINIDRSRVFNHATKAKEYYQTYIQYFPHNINIDDEWLNQLKKLALCPEKIDVLEQKKIFRLFMVKSSMFWLKSKYTSALKCEQYIYNFALLLYNMVQKRR